MTQTIQLKPINNSWGQPVYQYIQRKDIDGYYVLTITEKMLMYYLHSQLPNLLFLNTADGHTQNLWKNWLFNQETDRGKTDYQTQHDNKINVCVKQATKNDILRDEEKTIIKTINENEQQQIRYTTYWTDVEFEVRIWRYDIDDDDEDIVEIYLTKIQKILEDLLGTHNFAIIPLQEIQDSANTTGHEVLITFSISFYKFLIEKNNIDKFTSIVNTLIAEIQDYPKTK